MLKNEDKVRVENRSDTIVVYRIPETNNTRRFVGNETKEIPMAELRQAVQNEGTKTLIIDDLIIHSKEAVEELLPGVEPEYFYTTEDVDFLLSKGTLDQLLDALDFAPEGVINLIKEEAVKTNLNDMSKREAILEKTGFDVTKSIEIKRLSAAPVAAENKVRRTTAIGETAQETSESTVRRSSAPRYKVTLKEN